MGENIEPLEVGNLHMLHGNIETTNLLPMSYDVFSLATDVSFGKKVKYAARYCLVKYKLTCV